MELITVPHATDIFMLCMSFGNVYQGNDHWMPCFRVNVWVNGTTLLVFPFCDFSCFGLCKAQTSVFSNVTLLSQNSIPTCNTVLFIVG